VIITSKNREYYDCLIGVAADEKDSSAFKVLFDAGAFVSISLFFHLLGDKSAHEKLTYLFEGLPPDDPLYFALKQEESNTFLLWKSCEAEHVPYLKKIGFDLNAGLLNIVSSEARMGDQFNRAKVQAMIDQGATMDKNRIISYCSGNKGLEQFLEKAFS